MEKINNPYVSVELDPDDISKIIDSISKILDELDVPYKNLSRSSHISIGYVLGTTSKEDLENFCQELVEDSFKTKILGLTLIDSEWAKENEGISHFLSLEIEHSHDFQYATEYLDENFDIKEFEGGFKGHISLLGVTIDLSEEEKTLLSQVIELFRLDILPKITINGDSIAVFNDNREKEIEVKFPK